MRPSIFLGVLKNCCRHVKDWARELFGKAPERVLPHDWFSPSEMLSYAELKKASSALQNVDRSSWKDLSLDGYVAAIASEGSILAKQLLCKRIVFGQSAEDIKAYKSWHRSVSGEAATSTKLRCKPLLEIDQDLVPALFQGNLPNIEVTTRLVTIYVGILVFSASTLLGGAPALGAVGALLAFFLYATVTVRSSADYGAWKRLQGALICLLNVAEDFTRPDSDHTFLSPVRSGSWTSAIANVRKRISPSLTNGIPFLGDYIQILTLRNQWEASRQLSIVRDNACLFRSAFEFVANVEADCLLYGHINSNAARVCWREESTTLTGFKFDALLTPGELEGDPVSLECTGAGALITGANGAGKSTLLRALAMNFAIGNSLGFCYAKYARIPSMPVRTSMVAEDDARAGLSLYMAEMQRASEILADVQAQPCLCIFDEIFKGTNHAESVACGAAILRFLENKALTIVSSHHVVLAEYLSKRFDRLCVIKGSNRTLERGLISKTNGVLMMQAFNIPVSIISDAKSISDGFAKSMTALGSMASPLPCA